MTTLGTMEDRIADELARSDLSTQIRAAIRSAVNHYAGERWWFNEGGTTSLTLTLTSSVERYALPDSFERLDTIELVVGGQSLDIDEQHYSTINSWQTGTAYGQPTDFAIYDEQFVFYPIPNTSLNVVLSYVETVSTLTTTTCTNAFMTYGEELIRSRARADIQLNFLRDEGVTAEYLTLAGTGEDFYSRRERSAYKSLRARSTRRTSTSRFRPSGW